MRCSSPVRSRGPWRSRRRPPRRPPPRTPTAAPTSGCTTCRSASRSCSSATGTRSRPSSSRTPTATRCTATRRTSAWRRARPRSWSRRRWRPRGTSWCAASARSWTGTCPCTPAPPPASPTASVIVGTPESSRAVRQNVAAAELAAIGDEGYVIRSLARGGRDITVIAANTEIGALYGTFAFLRLLQTQQPIGDLDISEAPKVANRHLNNWEATRLYAGNNATGTGGLAGENGTIFNFAATGASADRNLPVILDRYIVVARALASIGINGFEINLVNADNVYLTPARIAQEAALADALRPYGIRISLAINYTAPTDPRFAPDTLTNQQLDPYGAEFRGWWNRKARQLQASIPDFMGFTVKANSEGQPGPQDFGYDHGDGANGIAAAVAPLGMKVYWRTFVYNAERRQRPAQAGLPRVRVHRRRAPGRRHARTVPGQRVPADQERAAGLPGPGAVPPDVRPHGEHEPGDRAADHPGVHRPEQDAHLPRAHVGGGPQDGHRGHGRRGRAAQEAARRQRRRRDGPAPRRTPRSSASRTWATPTT